MFPPAGQSFEAAADLSGTGPSPTPADAKRDPLRCCWRPLGSLSLSCSHEWSLPLDTQHHEAGICRRNHYCHPTSLLRRSWFEGGQRGQKEPAQHSDICIFHCSDMDKPKGSSTRLLPLLSPSPASRAGEAGGERGRSVTWPGQRGSCSVCSEQKA